MTVKYRFDNIPADVEPWNADAPPHNTEAHGSIYSIVIDEPEATALVRGEVPERIKRICDEMLRWRWEDIGT